MAELDTNPIHPDTGEDYDIVIYDCNRRRIDSFRMPRGYKVGHPKAWSLILGWMMSTIVAHNEERSKIILARNDFEVIS